MIMTGPKDVLPPQLEFGGRSLTTSRQNPNEEYYQDQMQKTDAKYQNITYWKYGKFETVHPLSFTPIDQQKALHETEKILWKYEEAIGFTNGQNKDAIHFKRTEEDRWHVTVPIFTREAWDGYFWWAVSDTRTVLDMIKLFFEELEWFGMLDFEMNRNEKGAER